MCSNIGKSDQIKAFWMRATMCFICSLSRGSMKNIKGTHADFPKSSSSYENNMLEISYYDF